MFSLATWVTLFQRAVMQGVPILFGATGEILTEKSGNLNLGIPGIMYVGGISGVIGSFLYEQHVTELNPFFGCADPVDLYALRLPVDGAAVLFLDRDPAGQPECNRFGHHHLWRWIR